jgi:hypothetical protein
MRPIPMGTHVAFVSRHVFPYVDVPYHKYVRQGCTPLKRRVSEVGRCPCNSFTHGCVSIVNGNECGCFSECWHERF